MLFLTFSLGASTWGQAVYPLWWLSLTKKMQTEQLLCWSSMTDTEHSTTSGSNEVVLSNQLFQ